MGLFDKLLKKNSANVDAGSGQNYATYECYRIVKETNQSIIVINEEGEACTPTKRYLREIADAVGLVYDNEWTTRTLGTKLIKFLNGNSGIQGNKTSSIAEKTKKRQNKSKTKHFIIFVHYKENALHTYDSEFLLEDTGYKSVSEYIEKVGTDDLWEYENDVERFLLGVNSAYVVECNHSPQYFRNLDDGEEYEGVEVDFERKRMILPKKGLFGIQCNDNLMNIYDVEVDASEEFDIRNLCVSDNVYKIIYNDKEYECCGCDGDDNGDYIYYFNGKRIDI